MKSRPHIAYYRVSTDKQGQSGLGLEAQQEAVSRYNQAHGGMIIAEFTEIESGKSAKNRPQLEEALRLCRRKKAVLVIAKLDRLSRSVAFIATLMESGVDFVAVDNPHANKLMLHMLAAFAEHEREQISERTKAGLAAAKARGVELGVNGKKLAAQFKREAKERAVKLAPLIEELKADGYTSRRAIARELNRLEIPTPAGGRWHAMTVSRVLQRL